MQDSVTPTRDMADFMHAYAVVLSQVKQELWARIQLFVGCETLWVCRYISQILFEAYLFLFRRQFHLESLNFEHAPKGWRFSAR